VGQNEKGHRDILAMVYLSKNHPKLWHFLKILENGGLIKVSVFKTIIFNFKMVFFVRILGRSWVHFAETSTKISVFSNLLQ
jgi:hypothetical protein